MADLFIKILNMSISAGWLILLVVFLRLLFRKMPKWIRVLLWGIVGLRLLLPVSLESRLSLIPSTETIRYDAEGERTTVQTGIGALDRLIVPEESQSEHSGNTGNTGNDLVSESPDTVAKTNAMPLGECSVEPGKASLSWFQFLGILWMAGMLLMLGYALFSYLRLKRRVRESIPAGELTDTDCQRVRLCDRIDTPFILGVFRPMVYLPSGMDEDEIKLVLAHEGAHLRRRDHLWKPLGFLLLTVYWFSPLVWAAYILLCRDIEMACDEKVIREMEDAGKKAYAKALVSCSQHRRVVMACPLAFGEVGVKERIKGIMNYKRPAFWVILLAIIACVVVAVCFLTNPAKKTEESSTETVESYEPYPGAVLKVLEASDTGCTLQLRNDGNKDFGIGKDEFGLEQLKDDSWVPVDPIVSERYSELLKIAVSPGKETEFSVTWQYVYGNLPDGEYRIVFYARDEEHGPYVVGTVSAEFSINHEEARKKEAEEKRKQEEAASQQREHGKTITEETSEKTGSKEEAERFNKEITQKRKEALEKAKDPENWKTPGEYPVTSKDEIWFYMSADEQRSVVSMPKEMQDTLDTMSTEELGLWFINYPFLMEVFMFDSASMGLRKIMQDCRVCETFFKRDDANAFLLKYLRGLEADKTLQEENAGKYFQDDFLKMYFNEIRDSLSAEEQAELDLVAPSPAIAIDCGESEMYSVEDREAAIKEILLDFNNAAELRKLVNLVYTSDQKCLDNLNYARELKFAKDPGVTLDECIVFSCDYKLSDGTFCVGWNYILGRVKGGNWEILTQGY